MPALVTTLRSLLERADTHFHALRLTGARSAYEELLERSQERSDRAMEVTARSMLSRCHLRRKDSEAARDELAQAARLLDPAHLESHARYRAALARVAVAASSPDQAREELLAYVRWSEENSAHAHVVDGCLLMARRDGETDRVQWLRQGIDHALDHDIGQPLGRAYNELASLLDDGGYFEDALEAYQQGLYWHREHGRHRQIVASAWAVGVLASRLEDFPLAHTRLTEAVTGAEASDDCTDLLALALADLAYVVELTGDVIEARRILLRALDLAREQELARYWSQRWEGILRHAKRLDLDV